MSACAEHALLGQSTGAAVRNSLFVLISDFKKLWPRPADPKVFKQAVISLATSQGMCRTQNNCDKLRFHIRARPQALVCLFMRVKGCPCWLYAVC